MTGTFGASYIIFGSDTLFDYGVGGGFYIVKYDTAGNPIWAKGADGCDWFPVGNGSAVDFNDNVYVTGYYGGTYLILGQDTLLNNGTGSNNKNIFLAKIEPDSTTSISNFLHPDSNFQVFPNPVTNELHVKTNTNEPIEIILYDIASKILLHQSFVNSTSINTEQLTRGIYIYELRNKNGVIKKGKVVKV